MSKAEQRALEKYPAYKSVFDKYEKQRYAYICGYIQAEKDLELTWEDMQLIGEIQFSICYYEYKDKRLPPREQIYKEVLKRFNKERKEK